IVYHLIKIQNRNLVKKSPQKIVTPKR
ncbi:hypothetical protein A5876_002012, partial [Enterococcus sp. 3C8_DIV0646]